VRRVIAYQLLSLDGVAESPDTFFTDFDDDMEENLGRIISSQDTVLLGRRTFDEWSSFWPHSDIEPFSSFINNVEKFVATSKTLTPSWHNAHTIDTEVESFVNAVKSQSGGDIGLHGSITLTQSLLELGLVDELRLVIAPTVQLRGRRLFEKGLSNRLTLTRNIASQTGYLMVDFRVNG